MKHDSFVEEATDWTAVKDELIDQLRDEVSPIAQQVRQIVEAVDDAAAGIRLEMAKTEREMVETRVHLNRLQSRVDNQMMAMVLANLASGVGVAALMLAATQAL